MSHFVSNENAATVLAAYANQIKTIQPTSITYAEYMELSETQKAAKRYLIIDYPGGGGGASSFAELTDVNITDPQNGQAPVYNAATGKWENGNVSVDISGKADKVANATNGHLASLDAQGNLVDSGFGPDDVGAPYVPGATAPSNTKKLWIDTANGGIMKYYNGSSWVAIAAAWT